MARNTVQVDSLRNSENLSGLKQTNQFDEDEQLSTFKTQEAGGFDVKPSTMFLSPNMNNPRDWRRRTFSKLDKGSLRGSIFALCASAIGSGVLSLPFVLRLNGYVAGILLMFIGAIAALISLRMLAAIATEHNLPNYSKIVIKAGGSKLNIILSGMILAFMFGSCISYQLIIQQLSFYVYNQLSDGDPNAKASTEYKLYQMIPTAIFLFCLSMKREMSAFRYVSVLSIVALFYTGIVLSIQMPDYNKWYREQPDFVNKPFYFDWDLLQGASMNFFSFQCQVQLLPIYSELVNPQFKRITKVIDRAIAVDFFFYAFIAVTGYFSSFGATAGIVLLRKEIPGYEGKNYPILIAVISIIGCITVAFPCAFNPFRQQFFFTIFGKEDFSKKENFILTFIFTSITLLIAFVFPTVTDIISILGGLCATSLSFAIPLYCYIKLSKDGLKNPKNICALLFFGVLILAGYASVILTVFRIVTKCDSYKDYHDNYPNCKNA